MRGARKPVPIKAEQAAGIKGFGRTESRTEFHTAWFSSLGIEVWGY
jgi:hypothetical protein